MERECYDEEVQPSRKMDYKPIIIITLLTKECCEEEVQPYRKTDYKSMINVSLLGFLVLNDISFRYDGYWLPVYLLLLLKLHPPCVCRKSTPPTLGMS